MKRRTFAKILVAAAAIAASLLTVASPLVVISGPRGGGQPSGGGGGPAFAYTPTHCVAPFASVTSATSDIDTAATAFTSCTAVAGSCAAADPCTLGEAMAEATAGNIIEVAAGAYHYAGEGASLTLSYGFKPANNGSSGSPIVFTAENPAAYNRGNSSLWSTFVYDDYSYSQGNLASPGTIKYPLSLLNNSYITLDGFHWDNDVVPWGYAKGMIYTSGTSNVTFTRNYFSNIQNTISTEWGYTNGDSVAQNCSYIFADGSTNLVITDNYFDGELVQTNSSVTQIELYDATFTFEHNTVAGTAGYSFFAKGGSTGNAGSIRYNWFENALQAIGIGIVASGDPAITIANNVVKSSGKGINWEHYGTTSSRNTHVYSNTFYEVGSSPPGDSIGILSWTDNSWLPANVNLEFYDNIAIAQNGGDIFMSAYSNTFVDDIDMDNNVYYESGGGSITSRTGDGTFNGLSAWTTQYTAMDAASFEELPTFTNAGADDFTLVNNGQNALTASRTSGRVGAYDGTVTEIGMRASPSY